MASTTIVTPPVHLPLTIQELKQWRRIEADELDELAMLDFALKAATDFCEVEAGRDFVTRTKDYTINAFPAEDFIKLPGGRLQSITSLKYTDSDGTETTWAASNYIADTVSETGRLHLAYGISWPSVTLQPINGIVIRYTSGYGTGDQIPYCDRAAVAWIASHVWENREDFVIGQGLTGVSLPIGALNMLHRDKLWTF